VTATDHTRQRRSARAAAAAVAAGVACLLLAAGAATAKPPPRPLLWGATIGPQLTGEQAPWDLNAVTEYEAITGKGLAVLGFSSPFSNCHSDPCSFYPFPSEAMENLRLRGTIPMLSWASQSVPADISQPDYQLQDIVDGSFDPYIRGFAGRAEEWGHPFFLRLNPEMNGFWFPWSEGVNGNKSGDFVAAWRHIHHIFESVGATNVSWVWCPNVDFERRLRQLKGLYPGDDYVDWTCLDGFNWGETEASAGWMTFDQIYRGTYKRILRFASSRPMMIGEVASDNRGGSKAHWIRNMLNVVPSKYRKVRALLWYDELDQGMHWPLPPASKAARAFAHGIRRKIYRPNVFSELPPGPIRPPSRPR
jgi:mannan endo-1,4-beta-mannosidase